MARLFVLLIALTSIAQDVARPRPRTERRPSQLLIDAVAVDGKGVPVLDLQPKDLEVWVSGYRVPIDSLTAVTPADERTGRNIVLILDDVTLQPLPVARVRDAARRFVTKMGPSDRMAIVTLTGTLTGTTDDRGKLINRLDSYNSTLTGPMRLDVIGEQFLTALASAAREQESDADLRTTVVGIGAGWLFETPLPPPGVGGDLHAVWVEAMRSLARANAVFYVIDPSGVGTSAVPGGMSGFSRETGGRAFVNTNDVNGAVDQIMREAGTYYLIGLTDPPVFRNDELRELDVRSLRRGVTIRARRAIPGQRTSR